MSERKASLSTDAKARKNAPMARGLLDYFPLALATVAELSRIGNEQHNPGQPMHWAKEKSTDHADCIVRHLVDRGTIDTDGVRHATKVAWRALALLQTELENAARLDDPSANAPAPTPTKPPSPTPLAFSASIIDVLEAASNEAAARQEQQAQRDAYQNVAAKLQAKGDQSAIDVVWGCNHQAFSRFSDSNGNIRCAGCGATVTRVDVLA